MGKGWFWVIGLPLATFGLEAALSEVTDSMPFQVGLATWYSPSPFLACRTKALRSVWFRGKLVSWRCKSPTSGCQRNGSVYSRNPVFFVFQGVFLFDSCPEDSLQLLYLNIPFPLKECQQPGLCIITETGPTFDPVLRKKDFFLLRKAPRYWPSSCSFPHGTGSCNSIRTRTCQSRWGGSGE